MGKKDGITNKTLSQSPHRNWGIYDKSMTNNPELEENIKKYEEAKKCGQSIYLDVDDLTDIAEFYHTKGEIAKALETVDYALKLFPGATLPLCFKAREAIAANDIATAETFADRIEDKTDVEYKFLQAEILISKGKAPYADILMDGEYENTEEIEKDNFAIDTAIMFFDYGENTIAEKWLKLCKNKKKAEYKELKSKLAASSGRFEESEKLLNQLLDRNPFSTDYWNQLASSQFLNNDVAKSIESCDYALAIDENNADALLIKANALCALENFDEAIKYYQRYAALTPQSEIGEFFLGVCLSSQEKFNDAIPHLEAALMRCQPSSPNLSQLYKELAFCYSSTRNLEKAIGFVDKIESMPENDKAEAACLRGMCYMANGDNISAMAYFAKAISASRPEQLPQICIDVAASSIDNKNPELARTILYKLFYIDGMEYLTDGWGYYALACFQLKEYAEFMTALKNVCERNAVEARQTLGWLFPDGLPVEDYISYSETMLNNKT